MLSTLFQETKPAILNNNYYPLQHEHPALQYYFREIFSQLDQVIEPHILLYRILNKYLTRAQKNFHGKEQEELAKKLQETLKQDFFTSHKIENALNLLNQADNIHPSDDLIWLLSAFYSVFPFLSSTLTNQKLKDALTIRDINDIYLQTIIKRFISDEKRVLAHEPSNHVIAAAANQYESFAKHYAEGFTDTEWSRDSLTLHHMKDFLKYATVEQADRFILPAILDSLDAKKLRTGEKASTHIFLVLEELPHLIHKISTEAIITKLLPKLLELYNQPEPSVRLTEAFQSCVDKLDSATLKNDLLPALTSGYFGPQRNRQSIIAFDPLIALISKLDVDESDEIANKIMLNPPNYYPHAAEERLTSLKKIREEKGYVNENLFQHFKKIVDDSNEAFIDALTNNKALDYKTHLSGSHLSANQVERILNSKSLDKIPLYALTSLASLPKDIYTDAQRKPVFDFILENKYKKDYLNALVAYIKTHDFNDGHSRTLLIDLCNMSFMKNSSTSSSYRGILDREYYPLLETCISLMTEEELKTHVIPAIKIDKLPDYHYAQDMHETFKQLFMKIDDQTVLNKFFARFMVSYIKDCRSEYEDLLAIMSTKIHPVVHAYTVRLLLKNEILDRHLDKYAYVLTLIYNKTKEFYRDMPDICKGTEYYKAAPQAEAKGCAMM